MNSVETTPISIHAAIQARIQAFWARSKRAGLIAALLVCGCGARGADVLYQMDFQKAEVDKLPEEFLVLDGAFIIKEDGGNKFVELPGAPLDSFSLLLGPTEKDGLEVSARIFGTSMGRRSPTFGLGLNGVSGYRLQVSPGKKVLELVRNDTSRAHVKYDWQSGKWTCLRLRVAKTSAGWKISGKAWQEGQTEPADWLISHEDQEELPPGRASIYGSPFSGTPIRFDDLKLERRL